MNLYDWIKTRDCRLENLLITDNVKNINAMIRRINEEGIAVSNLAVKTFVDIAKEIIFNNTAKSGIIKRIELISSDIGAFLIEDIIRSNSKRYTFVPQSSMCHRTAIEILNNINLLRENKLKDLAFSVPSKKLKELLDLVKEYEKALNKNSLYDNAKCLKEAIEILKSSNHTISYCGLVYCDRLNSLERELLVNYVQKVDVLTYEFEQENTKWKFFRGYGTYNEVDYVISDILNKGIPFGKVSIIYTSQEYETLLSGVCRFKNIPIKFVTGRSANGLDYIRIINSILEWAESNYAYERLKLLFLNKLVRITSSEDEKSYIDVTKEFIKGIDEGIGWGLDRYKNFISVYKSRNSENNYGPCNEFVEVISRLCEVFTKIEEAVHKKEIVLSEMFMGIAQFADLITSKRNQEKQFIKGAIREEINCLKYRANAETLGEAIKILREDLDRLGFCDEEASNAVSAMAAGGFNILERPYVYVIGLSDKHYKQSVTESPVLSDEERIQWFDIDNGNVILARERHIKRQDAFISTLSSLKGGEIHIGYSGYNTTTLEPCSPAALYLNLMDAQQIAKGDIVSCEYKDILEDNVIVNAGVSNEEAEEKATQKEVTIRLSASTLDNLVNCPLWYHYCYEQKILAEEYQAPVIGKWLNPAEKGSFVHKVLQDYVTKVFIGKSDISSTVVMDDYNIIFKNVREEFEEMCPVDSVAVAQKEVEDINSAILAYLENLHKEFSDASNKWEVEACELYFAPNGDRSLSKCYEFADGCKLNVNYSGCIDRLDSYVDSNGKKHYRIIDYKTSDKNKFQNNKLDSTTQHHIYAMFGMDNGVVDEFVYVFPLMDDDDYEIQVTNFSDPCEDWQEVNEILYQVFFEHCYLATVDVQNCGWCQYNDICYLKTL